MNTEKKQPFSIGISPAGDSTMIARFNANGECESVRLADGHPDDYPLLKPDEQPKALLNHDPHSKHFVGTMSPADGPVQRQPERTAAQQADMMRLAIGQTARAVFTGSEKEWYGEAGSRFSDGFAQGIAAEHAKHEALGPSYCTESATASAAPCNDPAELLAKAYETFIARGQEYGHNYRRFGAIFCSIFPDGKLPVIESPEEANRLQLLMQILNKVVRYAETFKKGGHRDSAHDLIVYAALLESETK